MKKDYLDQVKMLRYEIPVGLSEGLALLHQWNGDTVRVKDILRERYLKEVTDRTGIPAEEAIRYLAHFKYDVERSVLNIIEDYRIVDGQRRGEVEYYLLRWRNYKKEAIGKITGVVIRQEQITDYDGFRLKEQALVRLNTYHQCVVVLYEWLHCQDMEDTSAAIYCNTELTATQMRMLGLKETAAALLLARDISQEAYATFDQHNEKYKLAYEALYIDEDYNHAIRFLDDCHALIVQRLYDFIESNLVKFQW
jgi:hypothetical protein